MPKRTASAAGDYLSIDPSHFESDNNYVDLGSEHFTWGAGMASYDPLKPMPMTDWLALDEQERYGAVERFHRNHKPLPPSLPGHVAFHVIVENQLAESLECVCLVLARIMREGLDRHHAIHAVGSVVAKHLNEMLRRQSRFDIAAYARDLDRLSADAWLKGK